MGNTNCSCCAWYSHKSIGTGTGRLENKRRNRDHSDYSIIKITQNSEKSPGDLRILATARTPVGNHQLMMVCKTINRVK